MIAVLEETVTSCELESKARREAAVRLMGELGQEEKTSSSAGALYAIKVIERQF